MNLTASEGHPHFVGWWEGLHHTVDGEPRDVVDVIEQIHQDGSFDVFLRGEKIGGGRHVDFTEVPRGFTNIQEVTYALAESGPQLVIYRLENDVLEYCKAPEPIGRPTAFDSPAGSGWIHGAIRRIDESDPRIPGAT